MAIAEVDLGGLEETISASGVVLADFWGPMCGPCRVLRPHLERLADEHSGRLSFVAVNTEQEPAAAERFAVTAVPTLILFRDGAEVRRLAGSVLPSQVAAVLESEGD